MLKREGLNSRAEELRRSLKTEGTNEDVFKSNVMAAYTQFKAVLMTPEVTDAEINAAKSPVNTAISEFNDEMRMQRIEELCKLPYTDALREHLGNQNVSGLALKNDKDHGWVIVPADDVKVEFYDLLEDLCPVEINGIIDACCIFADNLVKWHFKDSEKMLVDRKELSEGYKSLRKRMGWEIDDISKVGKGYMTDQLNALVKLIFRGIDVKMVKTDVAFIETGAINVGKDRGNEAGSFIFRKESTVVNLIFRAVYTRYNKLVYSSKTELRTEKDALSLASNPAMAEAPAAKEKPVVVTETTVEIAPIPAKKTIKAPGAKKSA